MSLVELPELSELGEPVEVPLGLAQGRTLATSGVVSATPSLYHPGIWSVGPVGKVGTARVADIDRKSVV